MASLALVITDGLAAGRENYLKKTEFMEPAVGERVIKNLMREDRFLVAYHNSSLSSFFTTPICLLDLHVVIPFDTERLKCSWFYIAHHEFLLCRCFRRFSEMEEM
ncbi:hypothetical protein AVEN_137098-1 [Araneus ventricosus]|uniref:Uncharacterized protein n=1 Tax=Araneus ventricosus TaxID=182803 RepID=A0A4Y2M8F4_ARAVE|nr:hypothetical protein AVEN_137098-1 [Araneus ventricosus]